MLSQFFLLIKSLPRNDPLSDSAFPSFHQLSFGIKISYPKAPESPLEVVLFSMLVKSPLSNQHHKSGTHGAYPNVSTLTLTKWQFQALFRPSSLLFWHPRRQDKYRKSTQLFQMQKTYIFDIGETRSMVARKALLT